MKVAVVMGSKSDYPKLEEGIKLLEKYGIEVVARTTFNIPKRNRR